MSKALTQEEFIAKAKRAHKNKYLYDKTNYVNARTPVVITCPKHGDFEQIPRNHLYNGNGCPVCSGSRLNNREFIKRAQEIHGDKYSYEKTDYKNYLTKVIVTCPKHGDFEIFPQGHLQGRGCQICSGSRSNTENFIEKARRVHGDKYNYSMVDYRGNHQKVKIICPEHGVFLQTPANHLAGNRCPVCFHKRKAEK